MNPSAIFIARPIATTLLTIAIALAGLLGYMMLPVAPMPQVDVPTIFVNAQMAGASPEIMATSVATPLERHLGQIADVTEMTSSSGLGTSRITLQFGLNRDINGAARDVQAAIVAARADLPTSLRSNPTYRKANPADRPIMILALQSKTMSQGELYDQASNVIQQKLSQVDGVGVVNVNGSSLPAVRVELLPNALYKYGIGLEDVRAALSSANANSPKGAIEDGGRHYQIYTNDQASKAAQYRDLVIAYRNGRDVRLSDVAEVNDDVEDIRNMGLTNGRPSIIVSVLKQPGANVVDTVDRIKALLPQFRADMPSDVDITVAADRTLTIRGSLREVERTLLISLGLVVLVVYLFLGDVRATLIPSIAVPVSIIGTFGVMYLMGFSLNNLSLMALTISTGFVVDDAIVVLENVVRHMEDGMPRLQAALRGTREVAFTVVSMSLSLVAVFIPLLFMPGLFGRLFREFSLTLAVAILISMVVSLTTTPMMCAMILPPQRHRRPNRFAAWTERQFNSLRGGYESTLRVALRHSFITILVLLVTIGLNGYLFTIIPKGFLPQQDTGFLTGNLIADQQISFQLMKQKFQAMVDIIKDDPAVANVNGTTGGGGGFGGASTNQANLNVTLVPIADRDLTADQVIGRLRQKLSHIAGATLFLQSAQDINVGGRAGFAQYQYTLQADNLSDLRLWTKRLELALQQSDVIVDVKSDQFEGALESDVTVDRGTAARLGLNVTEVDNTLYDAFGQRQVSVIYSAINQYHVVMEAAPRFWQSPETLRDLFVSQAGGTVGGTQSSNAIAGTYQSAQNAVSASSIASDTARNAANNALAQSGRGAASTGAAVTTSSETMIPLAAISKLSPGLTPLQVTHQGNYAAATITFNLIPGKSLSDAIRNIKMTEQRIGMPITVVGNFAGTAKAFNQLQDSIPILLLAAIAAIYVVLGVLYESYIHPITILSTIPSATFGAFVALRAFNTELSLIAAIGLILLIGIVKKNAIMMVDFAVEAERSRGLSSRDAIYEACCLRFRPIMMTTMVALVGALPLALGHGDGAEIRRPLGIAIVGGLAFSQLLTLYTTPIVYLYFDRLRHWRRRPARREVLI